MVDRRANLRPAPPAPLGNQRAATHGCYSVLTQTPRAEQLAIELRDLVPLATVADSPAIDVLALTLAQLERASVVLSHRQQTEVAQLREGRRPGKIDRDDLRRLSQDARGWASVATRLLEALGMTPASRAKLGLDVARGVDAVVRLDDYLASNYGEGDR